MRLSRDAAGETVCYRGRFALALSTQTSLVMDSVLLNLIAKIRTELEEYGDKMEPPTPTSRLTELREVTQQRFDYELQPFM
jgi:hypothetical protein